MRANTIIVLFYICLFGFLGCSSPKNLTSSTKETGTTEEKRSEFTEGEINTFVDSTKRAGLDIKYFKIEFYPPEEQPAGPCPEPEKEPAPGNVNKEPKPTNKKPPDKGAIKSIEGFIINSTSEEKGIAETKEKNISQKEEEINTDNTLETDLTEETAEDPYKWRYILGILITIIVIGVAGYFLLRKSKVATLIKKLFSS
ncbi:MAG: hypothetical protein LBQ22_05780 [Bacteroidales bacterium]|nr:hypothetical protein [Bacteroidales bacterium]